VDTATQNNIFSPEAAVADAGAQPAISALASFDFVPVLVTVSATPPPECRPSRPHLKAAAAPTYPKNFRRVCICSSSISPEV